MTAPPKRMDYKAIVRTQSQQIARLEREVNRLKQQSPQSSDVWYEHDMHYRSELPTLPLRKREYLVPITGEAREHPIAGAKRMTPIGEILEKIVPQRK